MTALNRGSLIWIVRTLALTLVGLASCQNQAKSDSLQKLDFSLEEVFQRNDPQYAQHRKAKELHFYFCIPPLAQLAEQVQQIDPTIEVFEYDATKTSCTPKYWYCRGTLSQPKDVEQRLQRLSQLDYIDRISLSARSI